MYSYAYLKKKQNKTVFIACIWKVDVALKSKKTALNVRQENDPKWIKAGFGVDKAG